LFAKYILKHNRIFGNGEYPDLRQTIRDEERGYAVGGHQAAPDETRHVKIRGTCGDCNRNSKSCGANVAVQVMNSLSLPLVPDFLVVQADKALPPENRLRGKYLRVVIAACALKAVLGV